MIILFGNPIPATYVGTRKHFPEERAVSLGFTYDRFFKPPHRWRNPLRIKGPLGKIRGQEIYFYKRTGFAPVIKPEVTGIVILSDNGAFYSVLFGEFHEAVQMLRLHCYGHSFLGFRDPDLPLVQPVVLQRNSVQVHLTAIAEPRGFPHRRGKPSSSIIRYKGYEALIPRFQQEIMHLLLRIGVSDLDMARRG